MIAAVQQADAFEQLAGALGPVDPVAAGQFIRQQNIFFGRQRGQQMVGLKNEADFAAAQQRHAVLVQAGDVLAIQNDLAGGGRVEAGQKSQQRALAAARWSHDGDELAALNFQIDATQNVDAMSGGGNAFGESRNLDGGGLNRSANGIGLQFFIMALGEVHVVRSVSFGWMSRGGAGFSNGAAPPPTL